MRNFGRSVLFILVLVTITALPVYAQESIWVVVQSNLRADSNTYSDVLAVIPAGTESLATEIVTGELVAQSGQTSDLWVFVTYDGHDGYVWSGHVRFVPPDSGYATAICSSCDYRDLSINSMIWIDMVDDVEVVITNYSDVFDVLYTTYGRDLWVGYDDGGYSFPTDARIRYFLIFEVAEHVLSGPLMYEGTIYEKLVVQDDEIYVMFWYSEATVEYYLYVFRSMTVTCTPSGQHCGQHLNGVYAIPSSEMQRMLNVVSN